MDLFTIPRHMARLQYMTARLPFTVLDKYVVAPYWNDQARLGYESFLESMDGLAGWLLADGDISGRGQALMRRGESLAKASKLETTARARRAQGAETRAAEAEETQQAVQMGVSAERDRVSAAASQQLPDAADKRRLVKYDRAEADHLDQLAESERDADRSS